jgi:hypothetical protein
MSLATIGHAGHMKCGRMLIVIGEIDAAVLCVCVC